MENRLKELCSVNSEMQEKYYLYCQIKKALTERLRTVPAYFPHFSIHDASHSSNIIKYLSMLLGRDNIEKLSVSDLLVLCVAAYAHDISMSVSYEMIHEKMTSDEWKETLKKYTKSQQEELADIAERLLRFPDIKKDVIALDIYSDVLYVIEENFRAEHAKRSAKEILENSDLEKLFGIRMRNVLAEVCRLHGCDISDVMDLPYEENGIFDDYIHPRFDAALLALGDLLDMDTGRFDKEFLRVAAPMPKLSEIHKEKHESVTHFLVKNGMIEIKSNCKSLEVYRAMRDWIDWIRQSTEFTSVHWSEIAPEKIAGAPYLNESEILLNNDVKWVEFADLKFEISTKHALKLLGGTNLYRSKYVFVREVIQNAVDATMKRIYLTYLEQYDGDKENKDDRFLKWLVHEGKEIINDSAIHVTLSIENKRVKFVIEDKGIGISKDDVKRIASVEGKSDDERKFIHTMPEFFRPSGTFGIGLQSIFIVADEFEMITRTESEETKKITFQNAKDGRGYITVSDFEKRNFVGTTLIVYLNQNYFTQEDLEINDFGFKVRPREEVIYRNLVSKVNNLDSVIPAIKMQQQKEEYIPVIIENQAKEFAEYVPQIILQYDSLFADKLFVKNDYLEIICMESSISYRYFDREHCCIFNAFLCSNHDDKNKLSSREKLRSYSNYGRTIFYKNSYIESDFDHGYEFGRDRFHSYLDYSINLLSGNSEDILTLERRGIKEKFKSQLDDLIRQESEIFIKHVVDDLLTRHEIIKPSLLLIVYQEARGYGYRFQKLSEEYKKELQSLIIGGYQCFENEENQKNEFCPTAYELIDKELFFVRRYDEKDDVACTSKVTDKKFTDIMKEPNVILLNMRNNRDYDHPLNHKIKKQFIYNINDILYEVCVAVPFLRQNNDPYERDSFFKLEQFLKFLFTNRRCIYAWPEYKNLQTYINLGIRKYGHTFEKQVEMQLNTEIQTLLKNELLERGYIVNCCDRYLSQIVESKDYQDNLKYILAEYNNSTGDLEEMYQKLWQDELKLLEDERFKEVTKIIIKNIGNSGVPNSGDVFGGYFVM